MKFAYGLPVILLAATNVMVFHEVAVPLEPTQVNAIAKKITVPISGPEAGTGVLVEKKGNTYTVLTNWHVVDTKGTYTIQIENGGTYRIKSSQVQRLSGVDLAVFQFQSNQNYQPANIANSDRITEGTTVHAAGWADTDAVCEQRCYQFRSGNISTRLANAKDGYAWIYTNSIKPGMSGGPVLDNEGQLVGINGRGIRDPKNGTTDFFAIPINTYKRKLASATTPPTSRIPKPAIPILPVTSKKCQDPRPGELILLVNSPTKNNQEELRRVLPLKRRGVVCKYLEDTATRIGGFHKIEDAVQWAKHIRDSAGLSSIIRIKPLKVLIDEQ